MPTCLHHSTKIIVKRKKIEQINILECKEGDLILTPFGFKKILKKWITTEESIKVKWGNGHEVICGKKHRFPLSYDNRRRNYNVTDLINVKQSPQRVQRLLFKPLKQFLDKTELNSDYEFGRFIGLIVAEGGFNNLKYPQGKITLNKKENKTMNFFIEFLKKNYNLKKVGHTYKHNYQSCQFYSYELRNDYSNICNGKCKDKKLNVDYILNKSYSFREGLFFGIIEGDGHIDKCGRISFASASKKLRDDLYLLSSTLGYYASKHFHRQYDNRTKKYYYSYGLTIPLTFQKEFIKGETIKKQNWKFKREYKNVFMCKTLKFECQDLKKIQEMVDIEVEDGLFLIDGGLVTHNSVQDRLNTNHESIFLFVKNKDYFFNLDAVRVKHKTVSINRMNYGWDGHREPKSSYVGLKSENMCNPKGKNGGDCIMFPLEPSSENHYAMFPKTLPEFCILAGCPKEGIVLDPFSGGGTTLFVAKHLLRDYIGIEINPTYIKEIQNKKLAQNVLK